MARRTTLDLSGDWRAAHAAATTCAGLPRRRARRQRLGDRAGAGPLALHRRLRRPRRPAALPHPVRQRPARPDAGERSFCVFDGVFYQADVWLDGDYLGDTEGYFVPHRFEVTDAAARARRAPAGDGGRLRTPSATGPPSATSPASFGRSALLGSGHNPGGIWRPVRLHTTGPVRMRHCRLLCPQADAERATLAVRAVLDSDEPRRHPAHLGGPCRRRRRSRRRARPAPTTVVEAELERAVVDRRDHPLATGENRIEFTVPVPDPDLWWPKALGDQPLYDVGPRRARRRRDQRPRTSGAPGCATCASTTSWPRVNGERLFLKGVVRRPDPLSCWPRPPRPRSPPTSRWPPTPGSTWSASTATSPAPSSTTRPTRPGVLLWQDLPLQWALQRQAKAVGPPARPRRRRPARPTTRRCSSGAPTTSRWGNDPRPWRDGEPSAVRRAALRWKLGQALPSWNRSILDRSVAEALAAADRQPPGDRPQRRAAPPRRSSRAPPPTCGRAGTGPHRGPRPPAALVAPPRPLRRRVRRPGPGRRRLRSTSTATPPSAGPTSTGPALSDRYAPRARPRPPPGAARRRTPSLAAWTAAAQAYQAEVVRRHVETLRRLKYRPTGGLRRLRPRRRPPRRPPPPCSTTSAPRSRPGRPSWPPAPRRSWCSTSCPRPCGPTTG